MNADKREHCYPRSFAFNPRLRFYQTVVAVVAFVDDTEARGVGIAKDEELSRFPGESQGGFFGRHWFNCIATRGNDARRSRRGFDVAIRLRRHATRRAA